MFTLNFHEFLHTMYEFCCKNINHVCQVFRILYTNILRVPFSWTRCIFIYTVSHKKEPIYSFVCITLSNILTDFNAVFIVNLKTNCTCDGMNFTHLTWLMLQHFLVKFETPKMHVKYSASDEPHNTNKQQFHSMCLK